MSGLSDAVAVNEGRKRMNHGHLIDSGDHSSTNNNSEDYGQDKHDHSEGDDEKGNHRHTPRATNEHGIVLEKWSSSHARKTYTTGRKKPGGMYHVMLAKQRMQQVQDNPECSEK